MDGITLKDSKNIKIEPKIATFILFIRITSFLFLPFVYLDGKDGGIFKTYGFYFSKKGNPKENSCRGGPLWPPNSGSEL
jgi:hypothetical protein